MDDEIRYNLTEKAFHDYKLVQRALNKGDQKAYAELLERYRDAVFFMLQRMINDKDDADDLTIEAFGKAFKRLHQYTPNYAFSTWLFKIATNNCIDYIRNKKKHGGGFSLNKTMENEEGGEMSLDIKSEGLTPEEDFMKKQKSDLLRAVLDKLKPRYKELVELRYFEELSYEEIADKTKLPVGTVKAQLFRARELLFIMLKNSKDRL